MGDSLRTTGSVSYCTGCGARLDGAPCPRCTPPRPRRRRWWLPALVVLILLAQAWLWYLTRQLGGELDAARRELAAAQSRDTRELAAQVDGLRGRLDRQLDPAVARTVENSVFTVVTLDGTGSAFVLSAAGGISSLVTNAHVVEGNDTVQLKRGDLTFDGRVTERHESEDLAIVEVAHSFAPLRRASAPAKVGDAVLVVGSPLGLGVSVTAGIVSALREPYLQFSAPISPGNSGGPVVDSRGHVVGVTVAKAVAPGAEGVSFAIPVATLCSTVSPC